MTLPKQILSLAIGSLPAGTTILDMTFTTGPTLVIATDRGGYVVGTNMKLEKLVPSNAELN